MIAMHMGQQHCVDISEARIVRSTYGAPGIVKHARAIGIFEYHRAVKGTELVVVAAELRDLDGLRMRRLCICDRKNSNRD